VITHLIEPDLPSVSGGSRYNAFVLAELPELTSHRVRGAWPEPGPAARQEVAELVAAAEGPVVLDSLVGCSVPEVFAGRRSWPLILLMHMPQAAAARVEDQEQVAARESTCVAAADAVIATSGWAARDLTARYGRSDVVVAPPGVRPRPPAAQGGGTGLISVGAISPVKNQLLLVEALAQLQDDDWQLSIAGPIADDDYADRLRARIAKAIEPGRIRMLGELRGRQLDDLYHTGELLLLPSRFETYGLVVAEAGAAAIPAFVSAGTGAVEALGSPAAGRTFDSRDVSAWRAGIRRWLRDEDWRAELRGIAADRRSTLPSWATTAQTIAGTIAALGRL
jgi:glycosyltransferase involved in cell wall biosynthesis